MFKPNSPDKSGCDSKQVHTHLGQWLHLYSPRWSSPAFITSNHHNVYFYRISLNWTSHYPITEIELLTWRHFSTTFIQSFRGSNLTIASLSLSRPARSISIEEFWWTLVLLKRWRETTLTVSFFTMLIYCQKMTGSYQFMVLHFYIKQFCHAMIVSILLLP